MWISDPDTSTLIVIDVIVRQTPFCQGGGGGTGESRGRGGGGSGGGGGGGGGPGGRAGLPLLQGGLSELRCI